MRRQAVGNLPHIIQELDYALGVAMVGRWTGISISLRRPRFDEWRHYTKRPYGKTYRDYPVKLIESGNPGVKDRVSGYIGVEQQTENLPPYEDSDGRDTREATPPVDNVPECADDRG